WPPARSLAFACPARRPGPFSLGCVRLLESTVCIFERRLQVLKLDLFYEIDVPRPWPGEFPENQRRAEQESYAEAFEQIQLADKLGFNTIWLVEHHFREGRSHCSSPEVVHGALSQVTENIRLGFGVCLMPHGFTPPARVAEKVATVDVLST